MLFETTLLGVISIIESKERFCTRAYARTGDDSPWGAGVNCDPFSKWARKFSVEGAILYVFNDSYSSSNGCGHAFISQLSRECVLRVGKTLSDLNDMDGHEAIMMFLCSLLQSLPAHFFNVLDNFSIYPMMTPQEMLLVAS